MCRSAGGTATRTDHSRAVTMKQIIDAPVAQLILDLEERGLLNRTLVVLASEFSRDAVTEGKVGKEVKDQSNTPDVMQLPMHYGMHRHFTGAGSLVMFGGGIKKGFRLWQDRRGAALHDHRKSASDGRSSRDDLSCARDRARCEIHQ